MRWCVFLLFAAALYGEVAEGNIVDGITGAPVAWAYVSLPAPAGSAAPSARSDLGGHFRISVPQTSTEHPVLSVSAAGYLAVSQRLPAPSSPEFLDLRITLTPQAVITGRVEDEDGFPVRFGFVQALQYRKMGDRMETRSAGSPAFGGLGEYRISGLPAGSYYVLVSPIVELEQWDLRYSPEYYGGTTTLEGASLVEVKAGETRGGIDLRLKRRQGVQISAQLTSPASWGKPEQAVVSLRGGFGFWRRAEVEGDGKYVLAHVPPGTYDIDASARFPSLGRSLDVQRHIEVAATGLPELVLNFDPELGVEVGGRILSDGAPPRCPYAIGLSLRNDPSPNFGTKSKPDGTFSFAGVKPGHYRLAIQAEQAAEPAPACRELTVSARLGDADVLASGFDVGSVPVGPLEILVTAKVGTLTGSLVVLAENKPVWAMLVFEQVPGGRMFSALAPVNGEFSKLLLPGDYHVYAALSPQQSSALSDPNYRAQHANDLPMVHIVEGNNGPIKLIVAK
jgi:hypothetical protein